MNKITISIFLILSSIALQSFAFPIYIELPDSKTIVIETEAAENIENVKSKILEKQSLSIEQLQLSFNGNILENNKKISDYSISKESVLQMNILTTSKKDILKKSTIKLYPNPSTDFVQISGIDKKEYYFIYNTAGTIVSEGSIINNQKINIKNLSSGMYFLNLTNGLTTKITKI